MASEADEKIEEIRKRRDFVNASLEGNASPSMHDISTSILHVSDMIVHLAELTDLCATEVIEAPR